MVKLKQVSPDRLIMTVKDVDVELEIEDVKNRIREFIGLTGVEPDEKVVKLILCKLAKDTYEKKFIKPKTPDFRKLIGVELEEGVE